MTVSCGAVWDACMLNMRNSNPFAGRCVSRCYDGAMVGTVYWITGLSGAGKSTLGRALVDAMRAEQAGAVVYLDGDELRDVFDAADGHSREERIALARKYSRLCKLLADQGADVVIATISMFHEARRWNREHLARYREVYLRVPLSVLVRRDPKGIYARAERGEIRDVVGVDVPAEEPESPDLVFEGKAVAEMVQEIRRLGPPRVL